MMPGAAHWDKFHALPIQTDYVPALIIAGIFIQAVASLPLQILQQV